MYNPKHQSDRSYGVGGTKLRYLNVFEDGAKSAPYVDRKAAVNPRVKGRQMTGVALGLYDKELKRSRAIQAEVFQPIKYKTTPYVDLGALAYKATDRPSKPGFSSSGARPSAITNLLLSKWTDQENKRCIDLLSKSQAFKDAQSTLNSERQGVWASTAGPGEHRPRTASSGGSRRSSRPSSARASIKSKHSRYSNLEAPSARSSRPQSASARSRFSQRSEDERSAAAPGARLSRKVFAYDRTFVDPAHELRESVKLKDKTRTRRYGLVRPSSATIGSLVSTRPPVAPRLGKSHEMRSFMTTIALN